MRVRCLRRPPASLFVVLALLAAACGSPANADNSGRDPSSGVITERGDVGTQRLRVGDCFIDSSGDSTQVVLGVPCSDAHDSQVTALIELTDDSSTDWPGLSDLVNRSQSLCLNATAAVVGGNLTDPTVGLSAYVPDERSWDQGDRRIVCSLGRFDGSPLSGSLLGRTT